jgi:hypothetical protein
MNQAGATALGTCWWSQNKEKKKRKGRKEKRKEFD